MAARSHLIVLLGAHLSRPAAASAEAGRLQTRVLSPTITLQPRFWHASWGVELAAGAARAAGGRRGPWGKGAGWLQSSDASPGRSNRQNGAVAGRAPAAAALLAPVAACPVAATPAAATLTESTLTTLCTSSALRWTKHTLRSASRVINANARRALSTQARSPSSCIELFDSVERLYFNRSIELKIPSITKLYHEHFEFLRLFHVLAIFNLPRSIRYNTHFRRTRSAAMR